ncbi:MAG: DNA adenine methylase [Hyphomicrobiales bacterium]|nr:DNA adenine methylase [Hyphomicrobiales bacterium]
MNLQDSLLFDNAPAPFPAPPKTEGIKYTGSKLKIIPRILEIIGKTGATSVFDGFSGSTRVSQALAKQGFQVHSNDIATWSPIFATAYLKNRKTPQEYCDLIQHLNSLKPVDGWFSENYGGDVGANPNGNAIQPDGSKKPWQRKNTRRLDAIREEIDRLELDDADKSVALTSLILAMDKVENTLGHFSSYLKEWSPRSFNDMHLEVPMLWVNDKNNRVSCGDVFDVLPDVKCDLAYYDPPYGSNNEKMPPSRVRYAAYYHVWTTIIKNDRPDLFGKVGRRKDSCDTTASSVFEEFRKNGSGRFIVVDAIERLIKETPCEWIVLSYSSGGRATATELNEVIKDNGKLIETSKIDYQRNVMSSMKWTNDWTRDSEEPNREFLFLIQKKR